jgi:tRNA(Arg) A34 adenosine deaminase TadA
MNHFKYHKILSNLIEVATATPRVSSSKLAAAVVYKNRIISYGVNSYKTSPFQKKYGKNEHAIFLHAEIAAIKNALRHLSQEQLSRSKMIVCRINNVGLAMSKPCLGCQRALAEFEIQTVWYTTAQGIQLLTSG